MVGWRRACAGGAVGLAGTGIITVLCALVRDDVPVTVPALLLLIPIGLASVIARWTVGAFVAVVAAAVYAVEFLEPIGSVRIGLTSDVYVLVTFVVVAVTLGLLSDRRQAAVDAQRALLLGSVSHDLRNPLSTIRTVSSDLLDEANDDSNRSAMLHLVLNETDRMSRIVTNLLSISRSQIGRFAPNAEPTCVSGLVDALVERFRTLGERRLRAIVDADVPEVMVDAVQIDQALTNLVENAVRFAPPDAPIFVRASRRGHCVELTVEDSGPGVASSTGGKSHRPFRSADGSTGLGLMVCDAIVEAHGGKLHIGRSPSGGASVSFSLPIARRARLSH